jgi:eukaryotic-like serine/threonine-protein kinase
VESNGCGCAGWIRRARSRSPGPTAAQPFWAPDSRSLGFFAEGKLKKVEAAGGPPQTIADSASSRGGAWNRGGVILFAPATTTGLFQVSAAGGTVTPVTVLDPQKESSHRWPQFLPDGRHFLFFVQAAKGGGVSIGSLDSRETRHLLDTNMQAWYAPPGFLLFVRDGSLMAQSFDVGKAELGGDPMRIAEGPMFDTTNRAAFSTAGSGILAYRSGASALNQMAWFDRSGKPLGTAGPRGRFYNPELSPDGKQVAFNQVDPQTGNLDVWLLDLARGEPRRFTFDPALDVIPRWSPDGKQIIFQSNRDGPFNIYQKLSSGAGGEERLFPSVVSVGPQDWSADARFLVYAVAGAKGNWQLSVLPMSGEHKLIPFVENGANNYHAQFSHDSRWVAYASNESGRYEVYVQSFPAGNGKWQVSTSGGVQPRWRRDGKELFYLALDRKLMAVPVRGASTFEFGAGVPLFEARMELGTTVVTGWMQQYDVAPDGQRFLLDLEPDSSASPINVVLNWAGGLKK